MSEQRKGTGTEIFDGIDWETNCLMVDPRDLAEAAPEPSNSPPLRSHPPGGIDPLVQEISTMSERQLKLIHTISRNLAGFQAMQSKQHVELIHGVVKDVSNVTENQTKIISTLVERLDRTDQKFEEFSESVKKTVDTIADKTDGIFRKTEGMEEQLRELTAKVDRNFAGGVRGGGHAGQPQPHGIVDATSGSGANGGRDGQVLVNRLGYKLMKCQFCGHLLTVKWLKRHVNNSACRRRQEVCHLPVSDYRPRAAVEIQEDGEGNTVIIGEVVSLA